MDSISIIKREHRNLNAVLFTLEGLVNEIAEHGKSVDLTVFHGISVLPRFVSGPLSPPQGNGLPVSGSPGILPRCPTDPG